MEGVTRVIRGCGWLPNDAGLEGRKCFKRTGTANVSNAFKCIFAKKCKISRRIESLKKLQFSFEMFLLQIQVTHCVCQGDGCNSAPPAVMTGALTVAAALYNVLAAVIPSMP